MISGAIIYFPFLPHATGATGAFAVVQRVIMQETEGNLNIVYLCVILAGVLQIIIGACGFGMSSFRLMIDSPQPNSLS